ncbi:hypothetical protein DFH27DRAFT_564789 [Peziza echinospora]|nr:hypothetical protein DFH27DRAFT_564789 [Peziza echinospora]
MKKHAQAASRQREKVDKEIDTNTSKLLTLQLTEPSTSTRTGNVSSSKTTQRQPRGKQASVSTSAQLKAPSHPLPGRGPSYTIKTPLPHPHTALLLHLKYLSTSIQHSALCRIEAFYESSYCRGRYLSIEQVKLLRQGELDPGGKAVELCKGYAGFNFPLTSVVEWLQAMWDAHSIPSLTGEGDDVSKSTAPTRWWEEHCNEEEKEFLDLLFDKASLLGSIPKNADIDSDNTCGIIITGPMSKKMRKSENDYAGKYITKDIKPYIISHMANTLSPLPPQQNNKIAKVDETSAHELAHFAYHSCPDYARVVQELYDSELSVRTKEFVEFTLLLLGYDREVHVDEVQAYLNVEGFPYQTANNAKSKGKKAGQDGEWDMGQVKKELEALKVGVKAAYSKVYN